MNNSPAEILRSLLTSESGATFSMPESAGAWPLYVSALPDGGGVPDNAGAVYDTAGQVLFRLLASGANLQSYGIQLKVRALTYAAAYLLASDSAKAMSRVKMLTVVVGTNSYRIDTIRQTSPVVSLGQDERRRASCSVNFLLMLANEN